MRISGLLHRSRPVLPGLAGTARVDRRTDESHEWSEGAVLGDPFAVSLHSVTR